MTSRLITGWLVVASLLALGCSESVAPERDGMGEALTGMRFLGGSGAGDDAGFARALEPRDFVFPEDHGSHPEFRTEWWYFTGNVFAAGGRHFGFELTFFRIALAPEAETRASAWASSQIWMAHFALTDTRNGEFFAAERIARGSLGLAGASADPLEVWVEDWSARRAADGRVELVARMDEGAMRLRLDGLDRIVAQGERGLDPKGSGRGNASYYYSAPRLTVEGTLGSQSLGDDSGSATVLGTGTDSGDDAGFFSGLRETANVEGLAWMDHEWSTSSLDADTVGWDWFALQLGDGRDLMYYRLRGVDGSTMPWSGGTLRMADGRVRRLGADDVEVEPVEVWQSPRTGVVYPIEWQLRVPSEDLALEVVPRLEGQEMDLTVRYWEGAVSATGRAGGAPISGVGYLELAGY